MAESGGGDSGFGFGFVLGATLGLIVGAWLAAGPRREQVESLRLRTIALGESARRATADPESPIRRALQDGVVAARRRRQELELEQRREAPVIVSEEQAPDA